MKIAFNLGEKNLKPTKQTKKKKGIRYLSLFISIILPYMSC